MFLSIRVLHILCGALWLGCAVAGAVWLLPMTKDLRADAPAVGDSLRRRAYMRAVTLLALTTAGSGIWLFWRYTAGLQPDVMSTPGGMAFGGGGALSLVALVIGWLFVSRSLAKVSAMSASLEASAVLDHQSSENTPDVLRRQALHAMRIVAMLLVLATILMSVGHYI